MLQVLFLERVKKLLTKDMQESLIALNYITGKAIKNQDLSEEDANSILLCLSTLLEDEHFGRRFLRWLGDLTKLRSVREQAKKIPFGEAGLRIFCNLVRKL